MSNAADLEERLRAAYIGRNWERYYRERFAHFRAHPRRPVAWNWAAALVPFWPVYRNLGAAIVVYVPAGIALASMGAPGACGAPSLSLPMALALVAGASGIIEGLFGTRVLYHQARSAVERARRRADTVEAQLELARAAGFGGGSPALAIASRAAASLGLLLLGFAAFGSQAKFASTKFGAYRAAVKSDLHNLGVAQEEFRVKHDRFAASTDELHSLFVTSSGVTIRVLEAAVDGFSAIGTHGYLTDRCRISCVMFSGSARPPWPDLVPEQPTCRKDAR